MTTATTKPAAIPQKSTEWQGIALVFIGAFFFSTAILFTRLTEGLNVASIAFYRALSAFMFLSLLLVRFREPLHVRAYRGSLRLLLALGLIVSMTVSLYTYAIQHTTAANAALLVNSSPIYVALLAPLLLKEPRARYTWASLALAVLGIALVSNPAQLDLGSSSTLGILAGALSGFTYSFAMILSRQMRGQVSGLTQTMWSTGITALVLLPFAIQAPGAVVVDNLPLLIPLGIFSLGLSYLCYFLGLQRVSAQVVSVVALFEPVSGALIGLLAFQEIPGPFGLLGGLLILASIYLISRQ